MKMSTAISAVFLSLAMLLAVGAAAKTSGGSKDANAPAASTSSSQDENLHLEGEKRFRSNCGRCHTAPPKFRSRMMATIVRHMRVRANITDDDMRLILRYMTE
ncbi:MAG TPA: cytochrome c [Candidatus Angelobacter sp.]|nr:cytochrome c [Candidatus Angelobacter sp.]